MHADPSPTLRAVPPRNLVEARLVLHHASQLLAAFGQNLVPAEADDSHRSMSWRADPHGFRSQGPDPTLGSWLDLDPKTLTLRLSQGIGMVEEEFSLVGQTLDQAKRWLQHHFAGRDAQWQWPEFEIPAHSLGSGSAFPAPSAELRQVAGWFSHADQVLREVSLRHSRVSKPRVWPHHFDNAVLIPVEDGPGREIPDGPSSVGVGLSPGDGAYHQPYWYVSPWPYPDAKNLPPLAFGHWHTDGWVGAILTGQELLAASEPHREAETALGFLDAGISATWEALAGPQ